MGGVYAIMFINSNEKSKNQSLLLHCLHFYSIPFTIKIVGRAKAEPGGGSSCISILWFSTTLNSNPRSFFHQVRSVLINRIVFVSFYSIETYKYRCLAGRLV